MSAGDDPGPVSRRSPRGRPSSSGELPDTAPLDASGAAVLETFVVPRYLGALGALLLERLAVSESAQVAHLACRTGFPDAAVLARLDQASLFGCDGSEAAVHLAQTKASAARIAAHYVHSASLSPSPLPEAAFTHVLTLALPAEQRGVYFREMQRLLAPGGQLLAALPLRGSCQELWCLLREYAVARDRSELAAAIDLAVGRRPGPEQLVSELEAMGLGYVEVTLRPLTLGFKNGRDFVEDPVCRQVLVPEVERLLGQRLGPALDYVRDAIDRYWSHDTFELELTLGGVTARKPA